MIGVTVLVASFLANGILAKYVIEFKNKAKDAQIKFESTKVFADEAGQKIIKLEQDKQNLANQVTLLKATAELNKKPTQNGQSNNNQQKSKKPFKKKGNQNPNGQKPNN
jgi:hypothetical protein